MKGLLVNIVPNSRERVTIVTLTLTLPQMDTAQRETIESDFRTVMSHVGLHLQEVIDRSIYPRESLSFKIGTRVALFAIGFGVQTGGISSAVPVQGKFKTFIDAYCCLRDFTWTLNTNEMDVDYTKKEQARVLFASIVPPTLRF